MQKSKRCLGATIFSRLTVTVAALAVFALNLCTPPAFAAQATISWSAPTTNVDGTPLTDLAGFKVHIGNAPGSYQQTVDVGNVRSYVANNLSDTGTYYFVVTAYNSSGVDSPYSAERSRTFGGGGGGGSTGIAINCGSDASYTDASGLIYLADSEFSGGTAGFSGVAINNTNDDPLYQSERWGSASYSIPLANGSYELTLKFSESYWTAPGRRIFDVTVGGQTVINDLDIFARAGANTAYDVVLPVSVSNGSLNIGLVSQIDNPKINAIKVVPVVNPTFTITASAGVGGSISPAGATSVKAGASQSFTISPAAGYRIANVVVDGTARGALTTYSFPAVNANHSIAASFAAIPTNTSFALNAGGADFTAANGTVFRADTGFSGGTSGVSSVAINGTTDDALYQSERWGASSYSIPIANGRYNVTLKFAETYWTAAGRRVFDVRINGATVVSGLDIFARAGANTAYDLVLPVTVANSNLAIEFVNRVDNAKICAISVAPAPTTYSITASAGSGGSISPAGTSSFAAGSAPVYTINPAAGYGVTNVTVDGVSRGAISTFTFPALTANHTISATFSRVFTITAQASVGGTISPLGTASYVQGSSPVYRITPAAGYRIQTVFVNSVDRGPITSYTFSALAANHNIAAVFVRTFTITTTAGAGGSISPAGTATFDQGTSPVVTITPSAGYRISNVVVDGVARGALSTMSFPTLSANHTVSASFSVIPKVVFATNSGGGAFTDASGVSYQADTRFTGGNAGSMGVAIGNTVDDVLYQSERWGASSYSIPLANGNYELTLKFSETYWSAAGRRVFDVTVNGVTAVSGLDVFARAGRNNAYDVVLPVSVTNGTLRVGFVNRVDNAKVNAIIVRTR